VKVVDASVVLQWLVERPAAPWRALLEAHREGTEPLAAPELIHYEVTNVLVRKLGLPVDDALDAWERLLALEIETYTLAAEQYRESLRLAHDEKVTVYDASYLALARELRAPLVTADRKLGAAAIRLGLADRS
jgi:predicted nucleic acid-binding protein